MVECPDCKKAESLRLVYQAAAESKQLSERIVELDRDCRRWENARNAWTAEASAKDKKIAELEREVAKLRGGAAQ